MTIVEIYPSENSSTPVRRIASAPRDVATSTLLLLYCSLSVAEICVAFAAVMVSGMHYHTYSRCLLSYMPNGEVAFASRVVMGQQCGVAGAAAAVEAAVGCCVALRVHSGLAIQTTLYKRGSLS
jgi:hypothetical protein